MCLCICASVWGGETVSILSVGAKYHYTSTTSPGAPGSAKGEGVQSHPPMQAHMQTQSHTHVLERQTPSQHTHTHTQTTRHTQTHTFSSFLSFPAAFLELGARERAAGFLAGAAAAEGARLERDGATALAAFAGACCVCVCVCVCV